MHQWKRILVYFSIAIPIEDPSSNIETNSTPTDENEIAIDSRGNYSNCLIMHQYKKSTEKEIAFLKKIYAIHIISNCTCMFFLQISSVPS